VGPRKKVVETSSPLRIPHVASALLRSADFLPPPNKTRPEQQKPLQPRKSNRELLPFFFELLQCGGKGFVKKQTPFPLVLFFLFIWSFVINPLGIQVLRVSEEEPNQKHPSFADRSKED
jgi:hypothetical protein